MKFTTIGIMSLASVWIAGAAVGEAGNPKEPSLTLFEIMQLSRAGQGLTAKQAECVLEYIAKAKTAQSVRDIVTACVDYRSANPKLFSCVIKQQVKVQNDMAANAVHAACIALSK